jgi:hypothetical protein
MAACNEYALFCTLDFLAALHDTSSPTTGKSLSLWRTFTYNYLDLSKWQFAPLARQVLLSDVMKRPQNSTMTFTLFDERYFLNGRSGWRNGTMHRLS